MLAPIAARVRLKLAAGRAMAQAAVPEDRLLRLEPRTAIAAQAGGGLRLVEQTREDVQRELGGAEVEEELAGQRLLTRGSALGKRLHWRLDPTIQSALTMLDAIHERILPLKNYQPQTNQSLAELSRRAKAGV